ncbi:MULTISPECIES: cell division protein FtsZ [Azorhizobium]|uniref:Cell division protein FtsZ n=1 Tax=Azorhizobium caulinodans (strain ATCC 43989 / DSM 5975 / JCM 20966 / LMG 6465 / NBRC 14845 / NCIMB 13405 / ORS 571) TaxID=438753 RepID=A8HZB7_AZOC5|nr:MULTISPECIES: cell division protein FtsZ [Azorhizobium]TDT91274.1 cell division protein FtsZ [Azorhizobium sp. AG788]BAF90562.1 cell division protein [Azorhizobium caulinodans ORS 571]
MSINLQMPDIRELRPRITVFGCGGAGGNAVNNMISAGLSGVEFVVANTDAQALSLSKADRLVQMGVAVTEGLGAGSQPEVGRAAAEEVIDEIRDHLSGSHMVFITAGMGGGTGTGAAPVVARAARELGILTVGVVTKPFHFEGQRRMRVAEHGINELQKTVDTLIVIPNQNLFRVANEKTTFADAFAMADQVLYSGVACITDLMVKEGLINLDFADVRAVMRDMGKAMMGTGEASGDKRALQAAEAAIANPLLDEISMRGAGGLLISITGGNDMTLFEVDEAATRIREEVDPDANIILGATFDQSLDGIIRVSVVATGIDPAVVPEQIQTSTTLGEFQGRKMSNAGRAAVEQAREAQIRSAVASISAEDLMDLEPAAPPAPPVAQQPLPQPTAYREPAPQQAPAPQPAPRQSFPERTTQPAQVVDEVTIRAATPKPSFFVEPEQPPAPPPVVEDEFAPYIPPQTQRPRAPRMPRVDELPVPAQNQIRAQRGEAPVEQKRMTLLQRLASVGGLGRSHDEPEAPPARREQPSMRAPEPRGADPRMGGRPGDPVSEFAKRPATRPQAEVPSRQAPQQGHDDDQLDIPAFLRRQAN